MPGEDEKEAESEGGDDKEFFAGREVDEDKKRDDRKNDLEADDFFARNRERRSQGA